MIDLTLHADKETGERIRRARTIENDSAGDVAYESIADMLEARTRVHPHKLWMIFHGDDETRTQYSYEEFLRLVRKTADLLYDRGIRRGDRIATMAMNHADTVVQYFAAWYIGAVVVPINGGEDDTRISFILHDTDVKLIFVRTQFVKRLETLRNSLPRGTMMIETGIPTTGKYESYYDLLRTCSYEFTPDVTPTLEDDALIVYTSGTTGAPKGIVLSQYNLLVDAKGIGAWHHIDDRQRMMCVLPLHHVNGTVVTLLTPMYYGGSVVLNQKFHTEKFFALIAKEKVHVVSVVPTLLQYLLHEKIDHRRYDLSQFRHVICGAGPLTCELAEKFESVFGIPVMHGYGLSETTCYSCFLPIDLSVDEHTSWLLDHGFPSIGVAIPQNEMDIQNDRGASLHEGECGEIVIRGYNVMKYYFKNPEANRSTFAFDWFRSGDEGFFKSDTRGRKFFFITGRIKELIIRGGVNIAPLEIDEVLNSCPGVKTGIAVGFENDWYGEEVGALVSAVDGTLTEETVIEHCRKSLPFSKSPKVVLFSDEIPVTSTGKYQRNRVKELFVEWKSVQFKG